MYLLRRTTKFNEDEQKLKDAWGNIAALEEQAELDRKEIEKLENIIYIKLRMTQGEYQ